MNDDRLIPFYDFNSPRHKMMEKIAEKIGADWANAREGWTRDRAIESLPADIVADVDINKHQCSMYSRQYLADHCEIRDYPDHIEFWHKGQHILPDFKKP